MVAKRCLQVNLGRGREATVVALRKINSEGIDIVFFQEPYRNFRGALGFDCFRMNEQSKVVTLVRRGCGKVWMRRECLSENVVVVEWEKGVNERSILLVNVYDEPPDARNTVCRFRNVSRWLGNRMERVLLTGDFNSKNVAWGGVVTDDRGNELHDWVVMNGWRVENDPADPPSFFSNRGVGWPDLLITRDVAVNERFVDTNDESLSDHRYVSYTLEVGRAVRGASRPRYEVRGVNWEVYEDRMSEEWMRRGVPELQRLGAERAGALLQDVVEDVSRGVLRKRARVRRDERDWWNGELEAERTDTRRARVRFQNARGNDRDQLRLEYVRRRNVYKKLIKEAKIRAMEEELEGMGERVWDVCKRWVKGGRREVVGNMRRPDGTFTGSLAETYEELVRQHFPEDVLEEEEDVGRARLRTEYMADQVDGDRMNGDGVNGGDEPAVTMNELRGVIGGMSVGKSPGMDGIPNECMEHVLNAVGESWREIVEGCLREGVFPTVWKRAEVVWIPKKGGGMRPISLLPSVGKVLDRLVAARISYSMEVRGQFDREQYGFRRERDCMAAIGNLARVIRHNKQEGMHSLVVTLDLRNAFGSAWAPSVVRNLREKGVSEVLVRMVKSFMRERKVCCEGGEWDSDVGCPQGSSLGPVLWLLVMEGWFERMEVARQRGVHAQAYADDQVLIISGRSARAVENEWRRVWDECKEWAHENKLEYNVAKTEAMFIPARGEIRVPVVVADEERVQMSSSVKYLGVYVDRKLAWLEHVKKVRARVQDIGAKFFALGRRKWGNSKRVLKTIYERVVCPMVLYGAEVWGERARDSRVCKQLRAIERPYLRAITKAYRTAPTAALLVLVGCVPLEVQARAMYECKVNGDLNVRRVYERDRPHPSVRGYVPELDEDERENVVVVWTDAAMNDDGKKVYAWMVSAEGRALEMGGCRVEGELGTVELEGRGVLRGLREGLRRRGEARVVKILTDSQQVVFQAGKYHNIWRGINEIQGEIVRGMEGGVKISIKWVSRANDGLRVVDRECRRLLRDEGLEIGERVEGVSKSFVRKWKREWEMREWQSLWDNGTTGRWTYGIWPRVDVNGCDTSWELTQVATGHGDFRGYLRRFGLLNGANEVCDCGMEEESAEHVVLRCELPRRARARRRMEGLLDHYPPMLAEVGRERWGEVIEWANELMSGE